MRMNDVNWWKRSVVYQIYPKSFNDSNNDGLGDLNGITEKLEYLKDLGVDVLWLNPIYESPEVDNGYDISNYRKINPKLGTMDDFDRLLNSSHQQGNRCTGQGSREAPSELSLVYSWDPSQFLLIWWFVQSVMFLFLLIWDPTRVAPA